MRETSLDRTRTKHLRILFPRSIRTLVASLRNNLLWETRGTFGMLHRIDVSIPAPWTKRETNILKLNYSLFRRSKSFTKRNVAIIWWNFIILLNKIIFLSILTTLSVSKDISKKSQGHIEEWLSNFPHCKSFMSYNSDRYIFGSYRLSFNFTSLAIHHASHHANKIGLTARLNLPRTPVFDLSLVNVLMSKSVARIQNFM